MTLPMGEGIRLILLHTGSDGEDYSSRCDLEKAACEARMSNLTVVFEGPCNPCSQISCNANLECHVAYLGTDEGVYDGAREARCMCEKNCGTTEDQGEASFICASDGKTVRGSKLLIINSQAALTMSIVF